MAQLVPGCRNEVSCSTMALWARAFRAHKGKLRSSLVAFLRGPKSNRWLIRGVTRLREAAAKTYFC